MRLSVSLDWPIAVVAGSDHEGDMLKKSAIVLMATIVLPACSAQPKRDVWAVVVDIRPHVSPKLNTDEWVVEGRTPDGLVATKSVLRIDLNCSVGDSVRATAQGISMTLDDHACQRAGTLSTHSLLP